VSRRSRRLEHKYGPPGIFNTDQGRWVENVFEERLWRSVKYEEVYLKAYPSPQDAHQQSTEYFLFYNMARRHEALNRRTPDVV